MTYPPQRPPGMPSQGQGYPQQSGYGAPGQQPYNQQPQHHSPQQSFGQQPPGGQPYPQQPFPGQPQPGQPSWGQQPPQSPGGPPKSKLPIVLGVVAVVAVVLIVIGLVAVTGGDDSQGSAAQATTTTSQAAASTTSATKSTTTSATKPTTTSKAAALSPAGTAIVQAFPAALRDAVMKNEVKEKDPTGTLDTYTKKIVGTLVASDSLTAGLMHHQNIEHYPIAWIDTDPAKLQRIWMSQHPERTTDEGSKLVRIDASYPDGSAALEVFVPSSNLYFSLSGFTNLDAAKQFVQRAGF